MIDESAVIHPSAVVDDGSIIGPSVKIWHFCHVMKGASIGSGSVLGQNVFVGANVKVGSGCKVQNNVSLYQSVELENNVFCGPSCVFTNVSIPRAFIERKQEFERTLVKQGASIGANATIVCGTTIGEFALIGAGAVVTKDIPPYALAVGVPARLVGYVCECGHRLTADGKGAYLCAECSKRYSLLGGIMTPQGN